MYLQSLVVLGVMTRCKTTVGDPCKYLSTSLVRFAGVVPGATVRFFLPWVELCERTQECVLSLFFPEENEDNVG